MKWQVSLLLCCLLFSGCASKSKHATHKGNANTAVSSLHKGWASFEDDTLLTLFKKAREKNPDLKIALARIEEARFEEKSVVSQKLPNSNLNADFTRSRDPRNKLLNPNANCVVCNQAKLSFDASWELNLLSISPALRAAKALHQEMQANYQDVLITLYGDIAKTYFSLRKLQHQILLTRKNIDLQATYVGLTSSLNSAGKISGMDMAQAESLLARLRSNLPRLEKELKDTLYRLEILLGEKPGALEAMLMKEKELTFPRQDPIAFLPAKTLAYRPDVKASEWQLLQATALKKLAMAQYFPSINLAALLGYNGMSFNHLMSPTHRVWSAGSGIILPFFDFGRIRAQVNKMGAREKGAFAQYEKTLLNALYEIESAWNGYHFEKKHMHELEEMVKKSKLSLQFAKERYQNGLSPYMEVLITFKDLNEAEQLWVESKASVLIDLVRIYKALGIHDQK